MNPFKRGESAQEPDLEIFTIFDSKSKSYGEPVVEKNKDVLLRGILNMMRDPKQYKNSYILNAEDFSIFRCGSYDKSTGLVKSQNLEHVANMHDLKALAGPVQIEGIGGT